MATIGRWVAVYVPPLLLLIFAVWAWPTVNVVNGWIIGLIGEVSLRFFYYLIFAIASLRLGIAIYHHVFLPDSRRFTISWSIVMLGLATTIITACTGIFQIQQAWIRWQQGNAAVGLNGGPNQIPQGFAAAISMGSESLWPAVCVYAILAGFIGFMVNTYVGLTYVEEERVPHLRKPPADA